MGHDDTAAGQVEEAQLNFTHQVGISIGFERAAGWAMKEAMEYFTSDSRDAAKLADAFKDFSKKLKKMSEEERRRADGMKR